jgi:hypothetical protein
MTRNVTLKDFEYFYKNYKENGNLRELNNAVNAFFSYNIERENYERTY